MTWLPEWRVTVGDDVYTTVTSVSFASGRLDIDRQPTAGYCRVEIINTDGSPFTINVTEPILFLILICLTFSIEGVFQNGRQIFYF